MVTVTFTENIQRHVSCPTSQVGGATVREVLDAVFSANPKARTYVLDDQDGLRKHMVIFVDGCAIADRTRLTDSVEEQSEVFVMQALSGG